MLVFSTEKDKVLVPLVEGKKLAVINLVSQNVSGTHFEFLGQVMVMVELYLFKESSLVCINELTFKIRKSGFGPMEPAKVRVTYFQMGDLGKPYDTHNFNQNISQFYSFKFGGNQGNSHSLVYFLEN